MENTIQSDAKKMAATFWDLYEQNKRFVRSRSFLVTVISMLTFKTLCEQSEHEFATAFKNYSFRRLTDEFLQGQEYSKKNA